MLNKINKYINNIICISKQELRLLFSDLGVYSYIILAISVIFIYSYVYKNEVVLKIPICVVDQDKSQLSDKIIRMFQSTPQIQITDQQTDLEQAKKIFYKDKVKGIIFIPKNFSKNVLKNGDRASISIYCDGSYMIYYKQLYSAVSYVVTVFNIGVETQKIMKFKGIDEKSALKIVRPIDSVSVPIFNINSGYGAFVMPMVFLIALQVMQLIGMGVMGGTIQEEKKEYIYFNQAVKFKGSIIVVLGRSIPYLIISLIIIFISTYFISFFFNFPQSGNFIDIFLFCIPFVLSLTFLGIILGNAFKNREDSLMFITIFSLPILFLCGISWPYETMPRFLKFISFFSPSSMGVNGYTSITQYGASLFDVKIYFLGLCILSFIYFILAVITTKIIVIRRSKYN